MIISPFSRLVLTLSALTLVFLFIVKGESFTPVDALEETGLYKIPNLEIDQYDLNGATREDFLKEINSKGPVDPTGKRRWARVNWTIAWNWPKDATGQANFRETKGSYRIKLSFPRWTPEHTLDPKLERDVRRMLYLMAMHEKEHILNVLNKYKLPAQRIIAEFERNPTLSEVQANKIANETLNEIRQFDKKYDADTQYGKLEGISL